MGVTPIAGSTQAAYLTSDTDHGVKMLEKQKRLLQDQLLRLKESNMDSRMKQDKIKELNDQITEIEAQIHQKKRKRSGQTFSDSLELPPAAVSIQQQERVLKRS